MENANFQKSVDISTNLGYNDSNTNDSYEVIKMDEHSPINDIECRHEELIPDFDDILDDAVYHGCANEKCPIGFYIK